MNEHDRTAVYLTEEEALLFTEFQKRYAFIKLIDSIGGFNLRSGSLIINFDAYGAIGSVEKREHFKA